MHSTPNSVFTPGHCIVDYISFTKHSARHQPIPTRQDSPSSLSTPLRSFISRRPLPPPTRHHVSTHTMCQSPLFHQKFVTESSAWSSLPRSGTSICSRGMASYTQLHCHLMSCRMGILGMLSRGETLRSCQGPSTPSSTPVETFVSRPAASSSCAIDSSATAGTSTHFSACLLYTSPSPRDGLLSRMPSSA